jgi:hypothetical protein
VGYWLTWNYMNSLKPVRLSELKIQASFLLKDLKRQTELAPSSANRFLQLTDFRGKTANWLAEHADTVLLKHAYKVIAHENNFREWADLKHTVIENDCLYRSSCVAYIHQWFSDYRQAEIYFQKNGGYLLTFWKDFVVCGKEYIACIGLSDYEDMWKKIGYNWSKPAEIKAFQSLKEIATKNYLSQK